MVTQFVQILDGHWVLDYNRGIKREYKHPVRESQSSVKVKNRK